MRPGSTAWKIVRAALRGGLGSATCTCGAGGNVDQKEELVHRSVCEITRARERTRVALREEDRLS